MMLIFMFISKKLTTVKENEKIPIHTTRGQAAPQAVMCFPIFLLYFLLSILSA